MICAQAYWSPDRLEAFCSDMFRVHRAPRRLVVRVLWCKGDKAIRRRFIAWRVAQLRKGAIPADEYVRERGRVAFNERGCFAVDVYPLHGEPVKTNAWYGSPTQAPLPEDEAGPEPRTYDGRLVPDDGTRPREELAYARATKLDDDLQPIGNTFGTAFRYQDADPAWWWSEEANQTSLWQDKRWRGRRG